MQSIKNNATTLFMVIVVAVTILLSSLILSNTGFTIRNLGTSLEQNGTVVNTISVSGDGRVFAKPDMVILAYSFSELAATSADALAKVNEKVNSSITILKNNGIDDKDIQTSQLSIYTEYDWSTSEKRILGQRATVGIEAKVKEIDATASKVTKVIDELATINNIEFSNIVFDIENKSGFFTEARALAFNKAKQKATELAGLGGVKLLTPVSISDSTYDVSSPTSNTLKTYAMDRAAGAAESSTSISTGQLEIVANISVLWGIM